MPGSMFKVGHGGSAREAIAGVLSPFPFKLFTYSYEVGSGKSEHTCTVTIMEVMLPHKFPQLVLDSLVEQGQGIYGQSTLPIYYKPSQLVHLEGDFSRYYDVYAPDGYEGNALTILTPDVMAALLEHGTSCDMEIVDNRLYLYWPGEIDDKHGFQTKFGATQAVLAAMQRELLSQAAAVSPHTTRIPVRGANPTHLTGTWLSRTNRSLIIAVVTLYLVGGIVLDFVAPWVVSSIYERSAPWITMFIIAVILVYSRQRHLDRAAHRTADWGRDHAQPYDDDWQIP